MARLLSVNVGLPREIAWRGMTVRTAVWKEPVQGRRMVRRLNIDGDGQGDLAGHGGEHRAVFVYQLDSYRHWERRLGRAELGYGQFGENFTVDGLSDDDVRIGDRYRIGQAVFEVTQPRVTCYRVGIRMDEPQMAAMLVAEGRPGFYLRVIEEGEVEAGDEIVQLTAGPEPLTVAQVNALLYLPGHPTEELEQALRIPALSAGWRSSFEALLKQRREGGDAAAGNPGLGPATAPPPAWPGFRPLLVAGKIRESSSVTSLVFESVDAQPLAPASPGQFVVLRLKPASGAATLLRSYSLSGAQGTAQYRISVGVTAHGLAGAYIDRNIQVGDVVDASAPRGSFVLQPGAGPVVLLSAGIGATPVLAMLHALAAASSAREVWWIHGSRNGGEQPFAAEVRTLLAALAHGRSHTRYSAPGPADRPGRDFDAAGRLSVGVLQALGVPRDADVYLCGPAAFMSEFTSGLTAWGVAAGRIHTEAFGSGPSMTPGVAASAKRPPHLPDGATGTGPQVTFTRSGLAVPWRPDVHSLLELAEACDVPVRWSCRTGVCHNCQTGLIAGTVDYQPTPIDPPADGTVLICCSRPTEDLVLDL